ncbi:MAG: HAD family hydrolase [Lachnospiraceae bacterium]|jgi:phosphoglycolate phosphatase|nr:HAD family hydrolase [Lachnospiraceae bacterium]
MIKCAVFDLDGTLADSLQALTHTTNLTLAHFGLGAVDEAHIKVFVGDGYKKLVERSVRFVGGEAAVDMAAVQARYLENFAMFSTYGLRAYDGMAGLLDGMRAKGLKTGVLSNKVQARTEENIAMLYGAERFDTIRGERPGVPIKPDPTALLEMLGEWGFSPGECLYFGDTNTDMRTGKAAGAVTVGVLWGFRDRAELEEARADYIIGRPEEVWGRILR